VRRADNLTTFICRLSRNSGKVNLVEPSGPVKAYNVIALPLPSRYINTHGQLNKFNPIHPPHFYTLRHLAVCPRRFCVSCCSRGWSVYMRRSDFRLAQNWTLHKPVISLYDTVTSLPSPHYMATAFISCSRQFAKNTSPAS
jgi:hypothetical protein